MFQIKAFLGFIVVFLLLDAAWINLVVMPLYQQEIGDLIRRPPSVAAGVAFYLFYTLVSLILCRKALTSSGLSSALLNGALVGAATYGTYALTNYAVIEGWTIKLVLSDIAWGVVITSASVVSARIASQLGTN